MPKPERRRDEPLLLKWSSGYEWSVKAQEYVPTDEEWREYFSVPHNAWLRDRRKGSTRPKGEK